MAPKYSNFKEEISNYNVSDFDMESYESQLIPKIKAYMNTKRARGTWANIPDYDGEDKEAIKLHYGIDKDNLRLSFNHLLSLCLYTDYSNLCTEFSKSFRKVSVYDTMELMKIRNSKFYWMSRYLRETVQIFGNDGRPDAYGDIHLKAPFYTGLSVELKLPKFELTLCSPTSTSTVMAIGQKFATQKGILITLNNDIKNNQYLHGFSCSWISRFKEEAEVLFFGGQYKIRVVSIIQMQTSHWVGADLQRIESPNERRKRLKKERQRLEDLRRKEMKEQKEEKERSERMDPLMEPFLSLIKGGYRSITELSEEQWSDLELLISYKFGHKEIKQEHKHDYDLFLKTLRKQKSLDISFFRKSGDGRDIVMEPEGERPSNTYWNPSQHTFSDELQEILDPEYVANMFKPLVLELFDNLENIDIYAQRHFSLIRLLSMIVKHQTIQLIDINSNMREERNWQLALWENDSLRETIIDKFQENGFTVKHETKPNSEHLLIERMDKVKEI